MNITNVARVVKHIQLYPETHDQEHYHSHCGTKHCFAGLAQIMAGYQSNNKKAFDQAARWLDLTTSEAYYMFSFRRTLVDFIAIVAARAVYYKDGYDRYGYDVNGYDLYGFDVEGYDKNGYGEDGYNTAGYNTAGYNVNGYDEHGYDKDGRDTEGLKRTRQTTPCYYSI